MVAEPARRVCELASWLVPELEPSSKEFGMGQELETRVVELGLALELEARGTLVSVSVGVGAVGLEGFKGRTSLPKNWQKLLSSRWKIGLECLPKNWQNYYLLDGK